MLEAEFLTNGLLRVKETLMSFTQTSTSFWYYDLEKNLKSLTGKEGEVPLAPITDAQLSWIQTYYVPLAQKQREAREAQAAARAAAESGDLLAAIEPGILEKARRWSLLVTASLVADGSFDRLTKDEVRIERSARYEAMRVTRRMPTDEEVASANLIISDRDERSILPRPSSRG